MAGDGGDEGDVGPGGGGEALGELEGWVDVALQRVGHHDDAGRARHRLFFFPARGGGA